MPERIPKDYIVFPLDFASAEQARKYVELLKYDVGMFKIGLELFIRSGHEIIRIIRDLSHAEIFLDLKLHDIPATVRRAMQGISELGVKFATVHCGENPEMLKAAVSASQGNVGILGVTVLTSVSADHIREAGFAEKFYSDMQALVMKRAKMAKDAGCAGIVCSGLEVRHIKETFGKDFLAITPGIRPTWDISEKDDQQRITTPAQAVQNGADYIVIGRPIRDAQDPKDAARRIAEDIGTIF